MFPGSRPEQPGSEAVVHDHALGLGVGITLAQANQTLVRVDPDPEILNGADVDRNPAGQKNSFDGSNFHGKGSEATRIIAETFFIVNIIVDNVNPRLRLCAAHYHRLERECRAVAMVRV